MGQAVSNHQLVLKTPPGKLLLPVAQYGCPPEAADRLQARVLLIHCTDDDNVHMQNAVRFRYTCVDRGVRGGSSEAVDLCHPVMPVANGLGG